MSSPATARSMDVLLMVKPIVGKSIGLKVEGNGVRDPVSGLDRRMLFEPASSDTQQIRPPEDEAGEKPGGIKGQEIRCHLVS